MPDEEWQKRCLPLRVRSTDWLAPACSLNDLPGETISDRPERTLGTLLSLWVVGSLLVRATEYAIGRDHRFDTVPPKIADDSFVDLCIHSYVAGFVEPSSQSGDFATFNKNDAY